MKPNFLLLVILTLLVLNQSRNLQGSNTCCSQCNLTSTQQGPQTPSRLRDLVATTVSKNWNVSYFVNKLQQFPRSYFVEFLKSVSTLGGMVQNGTSSCGGLSLSSYPNQYLPSQFINTLYDSMINAYTSNPSQIDSSQAQAVAQFLTSLKVQFNNNYGIPTSTTAYDTFLSYSEDASNSSTGTVSSSALASSLASSMLNSADPLMLSQINDGFFAQTSSLNENYRYEVLPSNTEITSKLGYYDTTITVDFAQLYNSRQPPYGLRKFTQFVDTVNGNPFAPSVIARLKKLELSMIDLQVSDSLKAKLTSNLLSGYAYCFFPGLVSTMQSTCAGSCNLGC